MGASITDVLFEYWPIFLKGTIGTLKYAFIAVFFGTVLGTFIAIARLSKNKILTNVSGVFVTVIRGTPLLVQMYIFYFFIPMVFPILNRVDKVYTVLMSLILNSSAYVAEIIRSGIMSIDKGQFEAGDALGLSYWQTMGYVILPQALKNVLPALGNEFIVLIKETSVSGYIALQDLTKAGDIIRSQTYDAFMPLMAVAAIYLGCVMLLTWLLGIFERRLKRNE